MVWFTLFFFHAVFLSFIFLLLFLLTSFFHLFILPCFYSHCIDLSKVACRFQAEGRCTAGTECRYSHDSETLQQYLLAELKAEREKNQKATPVCGAEDSMQKEAVKGSDAELAISTSANASAKPGISPLF
jgi:hypothetical protein